MLQRCTLDGEGRKNGVGQWINASIKYFTLALMKYLPIMQA
jgi:hypothetical protein